MCWSKPGRAPYGFLLWSDFQLQIAPFRLHHLENNTFHMLTATPSPRSFLPGHRCLATCSSWQHLSERKSWCFGHKIDVNLDDHGETKAIHPPETQRGTKTCPQCQEQQHRQTTNSILNVWGFNVFFTTLPETNSSPLKITLWKRRFRTWKASFLQASC